MIRIFLSLLILFLVACTDRNEQGYQTVGTDSAVIDSPLVNEDIAPLPDSFGLVNYVDSLYSIMQGCGHYFTFDTTDFKSGRYIFTARHSDTAIMQIDSMNVLMKKDSLGSSVISPGRFIESYKGNGFEAVIKVALKKGLGEGGFYTGTLEIRRGNYKKEIPIHGESGCK